MGGQHPPQKGINMKDYKTWLLDHISECNKQLFILQDRRNSELSYQDSVYKRAKEIYREVYDAIIEDGSSPEIAEQNAIAAYDYHIDKNDDGMLQNIDDEISYYQYLLETYRLAGIGYEIENKKSA